MASVGVFMQSIWIRIENWLSLNAPSLLATLQPGASNAEIEELEIRLSVQLPEDVKASYRIHNGQKDVGCPFLYGYEFLSLEDIYTQWEIEQEVDSQLREIHGSNYLSQLNNQLTEHEVRNESWNSRWIPLATDIGGDHYCLDLAPAKKGQLGQIIAVAHEEDTRPLLAPSFQVWLEQFADALETGKYVFSGKYRGIINAEELAEYESSDPPGT